MENEQLSHKQLQLLISEVHKVLNNAEQLKENHDLELTTLRKHQELMFLAMDDIKECIENLQDQIQIINNKENILEDKVSSMNDMSKILKGDS